VRKPANSRTNRPAAPATAPVVPVVTEQATPDVDAVPIPFVAEPAPVAPVLPQKIEAAIVEAADTGEQVAQTVAETAEEAVQTSTGAVETVAHIVEEKTMDVTNETTATTENFANKAQNVMADMNEKTKAAMEKGAKGFEEMNEMTKGNVEALVEASRIAAKGLETLGQEMAEYGRKSFESATATAKTLASVKSPTEFMKLQSDFIRQSFDSFVAEASKTTELMMKLAGDAAQPISNRVAVAADKVKTAA
jgi:phasin family protein